MTELRKKKCKPCEGGVPPLTPNEAQELKKELHEDWMVIDSGRLLARTYETKDFAEAMELANKIGVIAEEEGHHPDLTVSYGSLGVELTTHSIGGLSGNDFILAAKIDQLQK